MTNIPKARDAMSAPRRSCCGAADGGAGDAGAWLIWAATPAFLIMALMAFVFGDGGTICSVLPASPLTGTTAMYLLMGVFHAAPWLRLAHRRSGATNIPGKRLRD